MEVFWLFLVTVSVFRKRYNRKCGGKLAWVDLSERFYF